MDYKYKYEYLSNTVFSIINRIQTKYSLFCTTSIEKKEIECQLFSTKLRTENWTPFVFIQGAHLF